MKKKIFITLVLSVNITISVFAQQTQRLTFTDMRADGTIIGTVTVNAVYTVWLHTPYHFYRKWNDSQT